MKAIYQLGGICRDWLVASAKRVEDYVLKTEYRFRTSMNVFPSGLHRSKERGEADWRPERAWREVPAYQHFLATHGEHRPNGDFSRLPVMNKENYVKAHSIEERCVGGKFLNRGLAIDESSGSSQSAEPYVRYNRRTRELQISSPEDTL